MFEQAPDKRYIAALLSDIDHLRHNHQNHNLNPEIRSVQKPIVEFTIKELGSDGVKFSSIHSISIAAGRLILTESIRSFLQRIFL